MSTTHRLDFVTESGAILKASISQGLVESDILRCSRSELVDLRFAFRLDQLVLEVLQAFDDARIIPLHTFHGVLHGMVHCMSIYVPANVPGAQSLGEQH